MCASSLAISSVTNCYARRARIDRAITIQWGEKYSWLLSYYKNYNLY